MNNRQIFYYEDYYIKFFTQLKPSVKKKFNWTLRLIELVEWVPEKCFKYLKGTDGLYEIRVEVGSDIYRVFCFFDDGNIIILINGFQKKTQKTPRGEIEIAQKLKKKYFDEKRFQ